MKMFNKKTEDFICENCGHINIGNGYTNHCSECLCSKHVDINPGDRASKCQGLMEPISVVVKSDGYIIRHRCKKCGFEKNNKSAPNDNFKTMLKLSKRNAF